MVIGGWIRWGTGTRVGVGRGLEGWRDKSRTEEQDEVRTEDQMNQTRYTGSRETTNHRSGYNVILFTTFHSYPPRSGRDPKESERNRRRPTHVRRN